MKNIKNNRNSNSILRRSIIYAVFCSGVLLPVSCTSAMVSPDTNVNEQIKAENRIMKQNLMLVIRENRVLKDENFLYKSETGRLNAKIKLLESEMDSLKKKYGQDVALLNEKYDNLNKTNLILQHESSTKIQELTEANKAAEERMTVEITALNETIRKQEEKFNKERAAVETAISSKELEYQKQIAQLKQDILTAGVEMETLKSKLAESNANLESAKSELLKKENINIDLKKKIDALTFEIEKKNKDLPETRTGNN